MESFDRFFGPENHEWVEGMVENYQEEVKHVRQVCILELDALFHIPRSTPVYLLL